VTGVLVVGAGEAAVQLAVSLRQLGYDRPVTLLGAEPRPPYQRPPLSKAYLAGKADLASLAFRTTDFYRDQRIEVAAGQRVTHVALAGAGGGTATTATGRVYAFERLALAVGARPRRLAVPGADLAGVHYLRSAADAAGLRDGLAAARRVLVVGGGLIGLEVAAVARAQGRVVTVAEADDRLMSRVVAPVVSDFYRRAHERRGVDVRLRTGVTALSGTAGRVTGARLADGSRVAADLVVVAVGVEPRTELASQLDLACDRGIVVDACARTSDPAVVAAGDCTAQPNPLTGAGLVRLESVPNAVAQAKVAAATLLGRPEPLRTVPWFWSDQYDLKLQIAGLADGYDAVEVSGDPESESFAVLYHRAGELLAVNAVNRATDYLTVRRDLSRATAAR